MRPSFYGAELLLEQGARAEAAQLFHRAAADCPRSFLESDAAKAELKAVGEFR
jgi:hypothetical protein